MAPRKSSKAKSEKVSFSVPSGPAPPGGPIEIVFSFDTTGSMSGCIKEVRDKLQEIIERLFGDIPGLRVAVFAHGDYCDRSNYVTKWVDFSTDKNNLVNFVQNVSSTGGGDYEECYELVLRQVRTELSWTPGTQRSLVMIGDAIPHPKTDSQNTLNIDWHVETQKLRDQGIKIYAVQCQYHEGSQANSFWQEMAEVTGGRHLKLDEFRTMIDFIMSICYRETGAEFLNAYEKEVRAREGDKMRSELNLMFEALKGAESSLATDTSSADAPGTSTSEAKSPKTKSRKRKADDTEKEDATVVALKKTKAGKVTKKTSSLTKKASLVKKPSLKKKPGTGGKCMADKLVAKAKKHKATAVKAAKTVQCYRESLSTSKFMPDLDWSKWYTAYQSEEPKTGAANGWAPRSSGHDSFVHKKLFYHDTKVPAVYEMAVQPTQGCKKYPVWHTVTGGFNSVHWDTYLLRRNHIQTQVDDVLQNGGKVFVRRGKAKYTRSNNIRVGVKNPNSGEEKVATYAKELRNLMSEVYDYAWQANSGRRRHRDVEKRGVKISNSRF